MQQPWIDASDLRESERWIPDLPEGHTAYQWRDTDVILVIEDATNEIVNVYEAG